MTSPVKLESLSKRKKSLYVKEICKLFTCWKSLIIGKYQSIVKEYFTCEVVKYSQQLQVQVQISCRFIYLFFFCFIMIKTFHNTTYNLFNKITYYNINTVETLSPMRMENYISDTKLSVLSILRKHCYICRKSPIIGKHWTVPKNFLFFSFPS